MFEQGIPLTDGLREIFDDCCKHYLSGREKSYATTYDWMLTKYFTARVETQTSDGVVVQNKLLPIDQRPTKSQMKTILLLIHQLKHAVYAKHPNVNTETMSVCLFQTIFLMCMVLEICSKWMKLKWMYPLSVKLIQQR